jgi:hypothetical protein
LSVGSETALPSRYTAALNKFIPSEDEEFEIVRRNVRYDVKVDSQNQQIPWFSESSSSQIYFNPTSVILNQERDMWAATLQQGTLGAVARFLDFYSVSQYAAAAREWIADFTQRPTAESSRISALTPEAQWSSPQPQLMTQLEGALAFDRTLSATGSQRERSFVVGSLGGGLEQQKKIAELLLDQGEAVVTGDVSAKEQPNDRGPTAKVLTSGTPIKVAGIRTDETNNVWLQDQEPSEPNATFISIPDNATLRTVDIGQPLEEILVPPRNGGLITTVDESSFFNTIDKIRSQGRAIRRVSIATPKATTKRHQEILNSRATYIAYLLTQEKIPLSSKGLWTRVRWL